MGISALKYVLVAIPLLLLPSCSAVRDISDAAREVDTNAASIQKDIADAVATGEVGPKATPFLESAMVKAELIRSLAARVMDRLVEVQDKVPAWVKLLQTWGWAVAGLALLGVLLYLSPMLRPILAMLGLIPATVASWAKLMAEGKAEEATAALRTDPVADKAFRKAKAKQETGK